jgi:hypothetical protein
VILTWSQLALASKVLTGFGFYNLTATSASSGGSGGALSGLGTFDLVWQQELASQFELGLGYSLFFSKFPGGDLGFGPDLGLVWYPFNRGSATQFRNSEVSYRSQEVWRPFVGFYFHHIQFQSLQSSYSGFGIAGGTELMWKPGLSVFIKGRIKNLNGPNQSSFSISELLVGPIFEF